MAKTLDAAVKYSRDAHDFISSQIHETSFPSNPRFDLVLAYVAIALEHQDSIIKLVDLKLFGSAFALLRPQIETAFRGLWVNLLASDLQVNCIGQHGDEPFPKFRKMAANVETAYDAGGWLESFADKCAALNGYTHSGLEQLGRRFRDDGNIGPNYPDEIVSELVTAAGTVSIGMLVPIYRTMELQDKAIALEKWLDDDVKSSHALPAMP